ncbi:MAG: endonuclease/exonuclease/phosphatase family protein [Propionicimonas sp.]
MQGPSRRTVLVGGLALLAAGCTAAPVPVPAPLPAPVPAPTSTPVVPSSETPQPTPTRTIEPTPTVVPDWTFRAMTYNILTGARPPSAFPRVRPADLRFANRLPVLAEWINFARPDVLAIQENEPMRGPVRRPLHGLLPLLPGYRAVLADTNIPILYRSSVFELVGSDIRTISTHRRKRYGAWCRLAHRKSGQEILVANTHLLSGSSASAKRTRRKALDVLTSWLEKVNTGTRVPLVLLGDFNTYNDYNAAGRIDAMAPLYRMGLRDSVGIADLNTSDVVGASSTNRFGSKVDGRWTFGAIRTGAQMLDYIWVDRAFAVRSWQVVTGPGVHQVRDDYFFAPGTVPSDHNPVLAELSLPLR